MSHLEGEIQTRRKTLTSHNSGLSIGDRGQSRICHHVGQT